MAANPLPRMTPAEYLAMDRASLDLKYEYIRGEAFAMAGGAEAHGALIHGVGSALATRIVERGCVVLSEMRVRVSTSGSYCYPDVVVACRDRRYLDSRKDTLLNPAVIVEVLSPSTEAYDRGLKFQLYRQLSSLREYVLVWQSEPSVFRATSQWTGFSRKLPEWKQCVPFSIDCEAPLAEIYRMVTFFEQAEGA